MIRITSMLVAMAFVFSATPALAESPAELNDLQIAHVAYIADNIDIRYAHLALAISQNPAIHKFAETMIRDHENEEVRALFRAGLEIFRAHEGHAESMVASL